MKTKTKKFSKKLLALFLAVVMAMTGFAGAMTAFAADSHTPYTDDAVEYNSLGWAVLTDEQVASALLDYADTMLAKFGPQIDSLLANSLPSSGMYWWDYASRSIGLNIGGIIKANISVRTHSVNELFETLNSVDSTLKSFQSFLGNAGYLHLGVGNITRENTSSCDIIRTVLGILQKNCGDYYANDGIGTLLRGEFNLGTVGNIANLDIYKLIGDMLGLPADYQKDLVYNVAKHFLLNNSGWFTDEEIAKYSGNNNSNFVYDEVLLEKMTSELLCKINVLVTYPDGTSSATRREKIEANMAAKNLDFAAAAADLGYDSNLIYSEENKGNILLFAYGNDSVSLKTSDSLFSFGFQALDFAWKTVLKDTVKLIHVNNSNFDNDDLGHGTNFDNAYYYWAKDNIEGGWKQNNLPAMYSSANINRWAEAVYAEYKAGSAEEFLSWVKDDYTFDRTADGEGTWRDIDPTRLFLKLRYSPLADYGFNMQTGPINLYFVQTGTPNLDAFFEGYKANYTSLAGAFNDCLVAAVYDLFVDRDNIYVNKPGDIDRPTLTEVNYTGTIGQTQIDSIASTLVGNALQVIQYVADTTDQNILNGFYKAGGTTLTETNLETAMVPLLVACIGEIQIGGSGKLSKLIHPSDWDMCKDAEGIAYLCLRENLSFSIPTNDYSDLVTIVDGKINATLEGTIIPMARDALIYVIEAYVPVTHNGEIWIAENPDHDANADLFDLLNSVICYYADDLTTTTRPSTERAMGMGALIGLCDKDGNSLITTDNTLWQNLDLAINKLLPVVGTLQGKGYGKADSQDLIMNDIIKGVLDIGNTSLHNGKGGVTNFLSKLLTIVCAEPIQTTPVINTVYNLLADLINGLFGARYTGQQWATIVPANSSSHPFDDVVKISSLAGTSGKDVGILQKMIDQFVEFTGYGKNGTTTYSDSVLRGICFALQAVNSFIPEAINNISEHSMSMATVSFDSAVATGADATANTMNVRLTNNSTGVNTTYIEGKNMNAYTPEQMGRYYVRMTDIPTVTGEGIRGNISQSVWNSTNKTIKPGESAEIKVSTRFSGAGTLNVTFYYDIVDENGNVIQGGLSSTGSRFASNAEAWAASVYNSNNQFKEYPQKATSDGILSASSTGVNATTVFAGDVYGLMPANMILTTDNLSAINNYNVAFVSGSSKTFDGFYCYENGSVVADTGSAVTVNQNNAIAICDEDGNLIKTDRYDYSTNGGSSWDTNSGNGYTMEEVGTKIKAEVDKDPNANVVQRTHIVYTLAEAKNAGIVAAAHKDIDGNYDAIYLKSGSGSNDYATILSRMTLRGPVAGIVINMDGKLNVSGTTYTSLLQYDGSTHIDAGSYDINMCIYSTSGNYMTNTELVPFKLLIGNNGSVQSVNNQYNDMVAYLANYKAEDFINTNTLDEAQTYLKRALTNMGTAVTPETVLTLGDPVANTITAWDTSSKTGEQAHQAFTTSNATRLNMPEALKANATIGSSSNAGKTGVYYFDAECTMPIYSNAPLTTATGGKDNAGMAVEAGTGDDAGKYFLVNDVVYEKEWDVDTFPNPWYKDSTTQAIDNNGDKLYAQIEFKYIKADGTETNKSDPDWVAKYAKSESRYVQTDSQVDRRGLYSLAEACIGYAEYLVNSNLKPDIADSLLEQVSKARHNLEENNFDVVTYNKMVKLAKTAESGYTITLTYTYQKPVIGEDGEIVKDSEGNTVTEPETRTVNVPFSQYYNYVDNADYTITNQVIKSTLSSTQVNEYIRLFKFYTTKTVERGYLGNQLEAEIKHASGNAYNTMTATAATYNEDGTIATKAVVEKAAGAGDPAFGVWSADGKLVNEDDTVYTEASWDAYVAALADAVNLAKLGNGDYKYKARDYFNIDDVENYNAEVVDCYNTDSRLQRAEIALEEFAEATITVATVPGGTVQINGADYAAPVVANLGETVEVSATADTGYEFAGFQIGDRVVTANPYKFEVKGDVTITPIFTSAGKTVSGDIVTVTSFTGAIADKVAYGDYTIEVYDETGTTLIDTFTSTYDDANKTNTFELTLPDGTYKAKVSYQYALTREDITIIVNGNNIEGAVIPMVACDFNGDGTIAAQDVRVANLGVAYGAGYEYCDQNADGAIAAQDVRIVEACAISAPAVEPVVIGG